MVDFRKLLAREPRAAQSADADDTELDSGAPRGARLEAEYEALIAGQCLRWGITDSSFTIEVRQLGRASNGLEIYVGMLRLARWERDSAIRLLLGLPLLEAKIRRTVRGLWLCEVSHFGGLWLHASEQLQATDAMVELRQLVLQLTPATGPAGGDHQDEAYPSVMGSIPPGSSSATSHAPLVAPGDSGVDKPDSD
jgi:hypothetical protein